VSLSSNHSINSAIKRLGLAFLRLPLILIAAGLEIQEIRQQLLPFGGHD
jgi:hypothetical protein